MNGKKVIKIMIIGNFLIFRNGLKLLLETEKEFAVCDEAADLSEAANSICKIKPDLLLIESAEIDSGNFDVFLSSQTYRIPILVLTNSVNKEKQQKYLMLGVDGLFSKEKNAEALFKAIRQVSHGDIWFDRKLMGDTIKQLVSEKKSMPEKLYSYNCAVLSEREHEVLLLICRGMKNKVIADNLFIAETTVRHHLTSIFEKLKVSSRLELVVHAFNEKLVEIPFENMPALNGANKVKATH
jgi:DNA-binding NarL/FixJ family response regulator